LFTHLRCGQNSYHALLQAIHTFPFFSSGLTAQSDSLAPDALFGQSASSVVKQLASLVDRLSYLGTCELLLPMEEVSLKSAVNLALTPGTSQGANPSIVDPRIVGALLERQLDSLEPSRWKESVHGVFVQLLQDALDVYRVEDVADSSSGMPVRRARVLVRCMEFVYRDQGQDGWSAFGFANVDEMGCEIERLVMSVRFFLILACLYILFFSLI
jgi:separase